jgi:hypothetical protein
MERERYYGLTARVIHAAAKQNRPLGVDDDGWPFVVIRLTPRHNEFPELTSSVSDGDLLVFYIGHASCFGLIRNSRNVTLNQLHEKCARCKEF